MLASLRNCERLLKKGLLMFEITSADEGFAITWLVENEEAAHSFRRELLLRDSPVRETGKPGLLFAVQKSARNSRSNCWNSG